MAKDDYYVIVYQILAYLYQCLKKGEEPKEEYLKEDSPLFKIKLNKMYWEYIMENLYEAGYIKGIAKIKYDDEIIIANLDKAKITPKGIEFLTENSTINKAKEFLKETKEIIPFI